MCTLRSAYSNATLVGFVVGLLLCFDASAKDFEMLAKLLTPAYVAQNFAALCNGESAKLTAEQKSSMIKIRTFADHVKTEVTTGLSEKDAQEVRTLAANTAQHIARNEMQFLGAQGRYVPTDALARWCKQSAETIISEILQAHAKKHEEFDRLTDEAKK